MFDPSSHGALREAAFRLHGRDWVAAALAWEAFRDGHPDDPEGYVRGIAALCEAGRTAEADCLAAAALERFPRNRFLLLEQGLICFYNGDWHEARRRYAYLRACFPDEVVGYTRGAEVAANLGDGQAALAILEQGCEARPDDEGLLRAAAAAAEGIHSWDRGAELWRGLGRLSDAADAIDGEVRCLYQAGRFDEIETAKAAAPRATPLVASGPTEAERAARFESLGGGSNRDDLWGYGCEFGYYQRSLGLEPLHFLRWSSIPPAGLLEGLQDGFDGISDPERITLLENDDPIWNLVHSQYGIRIDHTGMFRRDRSAEQARRGLVTHMSYLRDKFFEDLEQGGRILVYRTFDHVMPDAQLQAMAAAIAAHGPAQLLYVRLAAEGRTTGHVDRVLPNLLVGHIDAFAPQPGGVLASNHDGWRRVCEAALRLV